MSDFFGFSPKHLSLQGQIPCDHRRGRGVGERRVAEGRKLGTKKRNSLLPQWLNDLFDFFGVGFPTKKD